MNRSASKRLSRRFLIVTAVLVVLGMGGWYWHHWRRADLPRDASFVSTLPQAREALEAERFAEAEQLALETSLDSPDGPVARLIAGEAATRQQAFLRALQHYDSIARDGSDAAVIAAFSAGEVARKLGQLTRAQADFAYVLEHKPDDAAAHERMAFLLGITGQRWEARPHFVFLVLNGQSSLQEVVLLGDIERPLEQADFVEQCFRQNPGDPLVQLARAAEMFAAGQTDQARPLLRQIVAKQPGLLAAQAMLGELLLDAESTEFLEWHSDLPAEANEHPEIWFVRGMFARRNSELQIASRCFWEALARAATHRRATYQLGQVLVSLGETGGDQFSERAEQLFELTQLLDNVLRSEGRDEPSVRRVTELMEAMGRLWEARAWSIAGAQLFPQAAWPPNVYGRIDARLTADSPLIVPEQNLALRFDRSKEPDLASWLERVVPTRAGAGSTEQAAEIEFVEARDAQVDFVYENGADLNTRGARMFEQTGGGVAVLDFDLDLWPDLFLTQGRKWLDGRSIPEPAGDLVDCLYRNQSGLRFENVTADALPADSGFGQGCSVGDFNSDGFPDLFVANVGANQLLRNNGDGTFTDVTQSAGIAGEFWSTSCVLADLNGDGHVDLFEVNYVSGPDVYTLICDGRACSPKVFEGVPDRVFLSKGDGTFECLAGMTPDRDAKGLGVIAADLDGSRRLSLFIANDQVPNFLLRNRPVTATGLPPGFLLSEEGFASGLAFNEDGLAMACMGIAADDVNGDGRLDLLVTNFADEANTLYLQDAPGLFVDGTNSAGLRAPSLPFVSWGTQFLDADLDGEPDLVVASGHVDDYRDEDGEYQMRPQFFRNQGRGRFVELPASRSGDYFAGRYLGRGLARIDWNADGRPEFAVSQIGDRAALLRNETQGAGHSLRVSLVATASERDAIGSIVDVTTGSRTSSRQLIAGDGYQASNERLLMFGLGSRKVVERIRVQWPSGATSVAVQVPVDCRIQLIEGRDRAFVFGDSGSTTVPVEFTVRSGQP